MTWLQSSGQARPALEPVREFAALLGRGRVHAKAPAQDVVRNLLMATIGPQQGEQVLSQVEELVKARDPFGAIRSAKVEHIATALDGESPQAAALVLAELPAATSGELLRRLHEQVRAEAVRVLTGGTPASPTARARVAKVVRDRLEAMRTRPAEAAGPVAEVRASEPGSAPSPEAAAANTERLRRVALLLRGLEPELRDKMIASIAERDAASAAQVRDLMVTWEDVAAVADRSLQAALHGLDSRRLALALHKADPGINAKIRKNMSERAAAMIDEETSLLSQPKAADVEAAREAVLDALRQLNAGGELTFEAAAAAGRA